MAGHSQFKNIMHRKGKQDAARAKIFTKLQREIIVSAKNGMPDPAFNPRLRAAIQAARQENMPRDRIENAIKQAVGPSNTDNYDEIRYEGYGPGGTALIVEALTDNRNRTASEVRSAFSKHGGNLGETGSVGFMFDHVGQISFPKAVSTDDAMLEAAIDSGADDCESNAEAHLVTTAIGQFPEAREALEKKFGAPSSAKLVWAPKNSVPVSEEHAQALLKMIEALEDNDDVQEVFSNFEISDALMEKLSA